MTPTVTRDAEYLAEAVDKQAPVRAGVYRSVPDPTYRAIKALSKSDLWKSIMCRFSDDIDPRILAVGNAFDLCTTGRHLIREKPDLILCGPECDRRTKDGKATWAAYVAQFPDSIVLTTQEYSLLGQMMASAKADDTMAALLAHADEHPEDTQIVRVAWCKQLGCWLKSKSDVEYPGSSKGYLIVDVKTSSCANECEFTRAMGAYGYGVQAGAYTLLRELVEGEPSRFAFAVTSKRPDRGIATYFVELTPREIKTGREQFLSMAAAWVERQPKDDARLLPI